MLQVKLRAAIDLDDFADQRAKTHRGLRALLDPAGRSVENSCSARKKSRRIMASDGMRPVGQPGYEPHCLGNVVMGVDDPPHIEGSVDLRIAPIDRQAVCFDRMGQLLGVVAW